MYLLEGQLNTLMLAPYYPHGYKGGYVYAGNYKLMHKLAIAPNKVIMRPCGKLIFPENYSLALARYDRFSNKDKIVRPSKFLNDKQLLIEEQRPFTKLSYTRLKELKDMRDSANRIGKFRKALYEG